MLQKTCLSLLILGLFSPTSSVGQMGPAAQPGRNTSVAVPIPIAGECFDVEAYSMDPGASVIHYPCRDTNNDNQLWRFRHLGGGWHQIVAEHSGHCLAIEDGASNVGARVIQEVCKVVDNDSQLWFLGDTGLPGTHLLIARDTGWCVGAPSDRQLRLSPCVGYDGDIPPEAAYTWLLFPSNSALSDDGFVPWFLPNDARLFLGEGRFRVTVDWTNFDGISGYGSVVPFGADDSGMFWFFDANNWEMLIKVLDGCGFNGRYWVFLAATTDVEFAVTVTDTRTGEIWRHDNALGHPANAVTDTAAFATCP